MILIVDDKQANLFSLKTLLQLNVYDVDTASSGEEALKKILKNEYELIILDVQMPGMDGYEVAEIITGYSKSKDIPIIFLSAVNIDKRFITKGYTSGGVDYVTKPFDPDLLLLKIKTFSKLYRQSKDLIDIKDNLEQKVEKRTEELKQANKNLEVSNAELQQYAFIASHDLQEPLRKIITFTRIIEERFLEKTPEAMEYMSKIITSSERMRTLINDLLNYSSISVDPKFAFTDLTKIVNQALVDLEVSISEKNARIEVDDLPVVEVVPEQITQVFQNIISNALKFSKKDVTPFIKISGELVQKKSAKSKPSATGEYCRITITDNGIGFDEMYLDKIFNMFQRLHGKSEYKGTGIGLSITKKIIENHNGLITAKSKEEEGSTFIIILPVNQTAEHQTS
jgi:signal transduction histidine kinase